MFGRFIDDEKMNDWDSAYISQVLHSPVYAGHIIYEAKPTVSMNCLLYTSLPQPLFVLSSQTILVILVCGGALIIGLLLKFFRREVRFLGCLLYTSTEDSVEDDGSEFVAQADKLASMIVRITI